MQVGARLEREEQRRRTDDDAVKVLVAAAREAEAAALAAKQEAARNAEEHATRYRFPGRSIPAAVGLQNSSTVVNEITKRLYTSSARRHVVGLYST